MRLKMRFPITAALAALLATLACAAPSESQPTPSLTPIALVVTATPTVPIARTVTVRAPIDIASPTPTQVQPTQPPLATATPCVNDSDFVADVTIPDDTPISKGKSFAKTWRIKNSGTCAWDDQYKFVMISIDDGLSTTEAESLMPPVAPGENVDIEVSLRVDSDATVGDKLRATFQLRAPDGTLFGSQPYVRVMAAAAEGQGGSATISGLIWKDLCSTTGSGNCVDNGSGGERADGTRQNSETGIGGVLVELHQTGCTGPVIQQAPTASDGTFTFSRLSAGVYCIVINPTRTGNDSILIPGEWTFPVERTGTQIVTITEGEIKPGINFGWDPQFD